MGNENVGSIEYDARINTKNVKQDAKEIDRIAKKTGNDIEGGVSSGTGKAEAALNKFKTIAIGAFVAIGAAAVVAGGQAVKNAINLGESINAVQKTFEGASDKILEFGKTADKQAGLSKAAFNSAVVPIGAMLRNMGYDADSAADSSIQLASRAADLASVFNTDLGSALTAIQAGLRGEADPLERFGVGLNETSVKAYALSKGIVGVGKEMTAAQKTTARLGLLFEQTNRFAGDFVQTSDEAANKSRILAARYENLSAQVGQKLLPVYERLLDAGGFLVSNFDNITNTIRSTIPTVTAIAAAYVGYQAVILATNVKMGILTASQLALNLAMRLNPIGLVVGATAALVVGYANAVNATDRSKAATDRLKAAQDLLRTSTDAAKEAQDRLRGAFLSEEGAVLSVERAQLSYNEAVRQYGPNSLEAREAAYNLKRANDDLASATAAVRDRTREATEAEKQKQQAADSIVKVNNDIAHSALNTASAYRAYFDAVKSAREEDRKAGTVGIGKKEGDAIFSLPGRASGGPVSANRPYFVGENRDGSLNNTSELFVPRTAGTIVNSKTLQDALGGGRGGTNIENNIANVNISSDADGERWLKRLTQNQEIIGKGLTPQQSY